MSYHDSEFRRNLWEQFGIGIQSLKQQWSARIMNEEKEKTLDELVAWSEIVCAVIEDSGRPSADTMQNFRAAIDAAWRLNDYKKGEPV